MKEDEKSKTRSQKRAWEKPVLKSSTIPETYSGGGASTDADQMDPGSIVTT